MSQNACGLDEAAEGDLLVTKNDSWTHGPERYRYSTREDIPEFTALIGDPAVGEWLWFAPLPLEGVTQYFGPLLDNQAQVIASGVVPQTVVFSVEDENGKFLGQGAVVPVEMSAGGVEIGFQLHQAAWGRGVGTRLGQFLCAWAIERCDAYRIEGGCLKENIGSQTLLKKLGLTLEGSKPGYRLKGDTRHTELLFGTEVSKMDTTLFHQVAKTTGLI